MQINIRESCAGVSDGMRCRLGENDPLFGENDDGGESNRAVW